MKIAFACDHAGFSFRQALINHLKALGHETIDVWPQIVDPFDDFPEYAKLVCDSVIQWKAERGILVCGTGIGMSIAANRYNWIRAVLAYSPSISKIGRTHNDTNVVCFGARTMPLDEVLQSLEIFLSEAFLGDKYQKRNDQLDCLC